MDSTTVKKRIPIKVTLPEDVHEWLLKRALHNERSRGAELGQILKVVMTQATDSTSQASV